MLAVEKQKECDIIASSKTLVIHCCEYNNEGGNFYESAFARLQLCI